MSADRTDFDSELRRHHTALRQATHIRPSDRVLDIGCGAGQTTIEAARAALSGEAIGVDISESSIDRARHRADAAKLRNVDFICGDAQTYAFPEGHFDLVISRFGTMFFDDPAEAFANIGRALRPAGRLVMMVWQPLERNDWIVAIKNSLQASGAPESVASRQLDPFSLADPASVTELLESAEFIDIRFTDVSEPVCYGDDVDSAMAWIRGFTCTSEALNHLDAPAGEVAVSRLRQMLAEHLTDDGVWFDSRAWIVTAQRR